MRIEEWFDFIDNNVICAEDIENIIFDPELSLDDVECLVNRLRYRRWFK